MRNKFLKKKEEDKRLRELENKNNKNESACLNKKDLININDDNKDINKNEESQKVLNKTKNNENKEEKIIHGNKLEEKTDEVKESIRKMNRQKNYTYKPKYANKNIELESSKENMEQTLIDNNENKNKDNERNMTYYLYGIESNDYFHIFDISNKNYEKIQISKLNLDEKSSTFKKDYQYEGTFYITL